MKMRLVGAELFHMDGWTVMMKLVVTFHNFVNAPERGAELRSNALWKI
jgi:hypothetical protein